MMTLLSHLITLFSLLCHISKFNTYDTLMTPPLTLTSSIHTRERLDADEACAGLLLRSARAMDANLWKCHLI